MNHWCESCARKNLCYVVDDRPKCFVPITNTASGTPESYLAKSLRDSRDSHEIAKTEPQTETKNSNLTFEKRTMRDCYNCKRYETEGECIECHYEPKDEPQIFTWGKEVHEFCKMKCNKSKARSFDGDRFIVCGQSNDAICINLPACPLGKWTTGKGYHILPMDEPQTEAWKEPFETDCSWK